MLQWIGGDVNKDVLQCVNFLLDRGYVRVWNETDASVSPAPDVLLCITADGQDVLDGTVRDLSVIIPQNNGR